MVRDFVKLVAQGYDRMALDYLAWREQDPVLFRSELEDLAKRLPSDASVLDVGCGAGVPFTAWLSERFRVTGVDVSAVQVRLAAERVPKATFLRQDMLALDVPHAFDAALCLYALIHVPRHQHVLALGNIRNALKPGGYLLIITGDENLPESVEEFFGADMFWSHFDRETSLQMIREAGFTIIWDKVVADRPAGSHILVLARREVG